MFMKNRAEHIALIVAGATLANAAMFAGNAQDARPAAETPKVTAWGTLVALQAGWGIDRMLVFHAAPMINADPACPLITNGYIVNETQTGHNLFNTMLLSALLNRREVQFVILGCYEQRPVIVSVSVR